MLRRSGGEALIRPPNRTVYCAQECCAYGAQTPYTPMDMFDVITECTHKYNVKCTENALMKCNIINIQYCIIYS